VVDRLPARDVLHDGHQAGAALAGSGTGDEGECHAPGDVPRPLPVALCVEPVHDPDADAAWVALTVEAAAPLGEVLDLDAAVLAEWSTRVGRHVLDRLVVMMYPADDGRS
jgi:hypothetical protein